MYSVYCHTFPNGKKYIGITNNPEKRWNNGKGYDTQPKMKRAIDCYGWDNIKHEIIIDGLDYETAAKIEKIMISAYNSIEDGYNVSIGGGDINGYYITSYLSEMINAANHYLYGAENPIVDMAFNDRKKPIESGFWNEATEAVIKKHRRFSTTSETDVAEFWYHITCYFDLFCKKESGEDISDWKEKSFPEYIYDLCFKTL